MNNIDILFTEAMTPNKFMRVCPNIGHTLIIDITKEDILSEDMSDIYSWINTLLRVEHAKQCRVNLCIHGYDNDNREAYEIPEVVDYIKYLFNRRPELYFFLDLASKRFVVICYASKGYGLTNSIQKEIILDKNKVLEFIKNITTKISINNKFNYSDELYLLSDLKSIILLK
ncbi:hypothetical protein [Clostridium sp. CCUG 7971]|uniref:hypothetical protein n=1 Tax=Clostridium sp. CCUG 7971 TaxID=2811414 RepID=UPI001ABA6982|nr:hypothetical protein [Clostridium sp. CCUG 7971]MBO3445563.1 hypothetical protein [Clostridium sp. CCUG 7971]